MDAFLNFPITLSPKNVVVLLSLLMALSFKSAAQNCIDPTLIDTTKFCTTLYDPVCGCNGTTYPNACVAKNYYGITSFTPGTCGTGTCEAVKPNFKWELDSAQPLKVTFVDKTETGGGQITRWTWKFSDGTTSDVQNPVKVFTTPGVQKACLEVRVVLSNTTVCEKSICYELNLTGSTPCTGECPFSIFYEFSGKVLRAKLTGNSTTLPSPISWSYDNGAVTRTGTVFEYELPVMNDRHQLCATYTVPGTTRTCTTCTAFRAGVAKAACRDSSFIQPNTVCPTVEQPVCGCNGETYRNACMALSMNGVTQWRYGPCQQATLCDALNIDFEAYLTPGIAPNVWAFRGIATPAAASSTFSWKWEFGDGKVDDGQTLTHFYSGPGTYTVCLTVGLNTPNGLICTKTICKKIAVGGAVSGACINPAWIHPGAVCPTVEDPVCGCNAVTYKNECSALNAGVTSWIKGACCKKDSCATKAAFEYKIPVSNPLLVQFGNKTEPGGATITNWLWKFGDGATSTEQNPSHQYAAPGVYKVCLSVRGVLPSGKVCENVFCQEIELKQLTTCSDSCKFRIRYVQQGKQLYAWLQADNPQLANPTEVRWTIEGQNLVFPGLRFIYQFAQRGKYVLCASYLPAANGSRCTVCQVIAVEPQSIVCIDSTNTNLNPCPTVVEPVCGCNGETYSNACIAQNWNGVRSWRPGRCSEASRCDQLYVNFEGFNSGGALTTWTFNGDAFFPSADATLTWNWNFGNGQSSTDKSPTLNFQNAGVYEVCLTVKLSLAGQALCSRTVCQTINIGCPAPPCVRPDLIDLTLPCPTTEKPVCGCDGKTYRNKCVAVFGHGVTQWKEGACGNACINPAWIDSGIVCPAVVEPVCGCDGKIYSNACEAQRQGVTSWIRARRTVSSPDMEERHGLQVVPNPTSDLLYIQTEGYMPTSAHLFDALGRLIAEKPVHAAAFDWSLQGLSSGVYWLKVRMEDGREVVAKIMKE